MIHACEEAARLHHQGVERQMSELRCPTCGSTNITVQAITRQEGTTKGFGCIKSIIGFILFSIPGILCGLCGMGKGKIKTTISQIRVCQNCGAQWQEGS